MNPIFEYNSKGKFLAQYNSKEHYEFDKIASGTFKDHGNYMIDSEGNVAFYTRVGRDKAKRTVVFHNYISSMKATRNGNKPFSIYDITGVKIATFNSVHDCVNITKMDETFIRNKLNNKSSITTNLKTEDGIYFIYQSQEQDLEVVNFKNTL